MFTQEEIAAMAKEAGFLIGKLDTLEGSRPLIKPVGFDCLAELERFAELVAAKKQEECAQVCEAVWGERGKPFYGVPGLKGSAKECAAAIRARGQKGGV